MCLSVCVISGCFGMDPCLSVFACLIGKKGATIKCVKRCRGEFDELTHVWRWEQECQGLLGGLACQSSSGVNRIILQKLSIFRSPSCHIFHCYFLKLGDAVVALHPRFLLSYCFRSSWSIKFIVDFISFTEILKSYIFSSPSLFCKFISKHCPVCSEHTRHDTYFTKRQAV